MQPLSIATNGSPTPARCAAEMLEALPPIMRFVRRQMRSHRGRALSVPQFRVLAMLRTFPTTNLSTVAEVLAASRPTMSRIVSLLVRKGLVRRRARRRDRRHLELEVTARGRTVMEVARRATRRHIARELGALDRRSRGHVLQAMRALRDLFGARLRDENSRLRREEASS
jgi:DNA-binding MarR family transcriptional regulator